jgi:hypothetical protein
MSIGGSLKKSARSLQIRFKNAPWAGLHDHRSAHTERPHIISAATASAIKLTVVHKTVAKPL